MMTSSVLTEKTSSNGKRTAVILLITAQNSQGRKQDGAGTCSRHSLDTITQSGKQASLSKQLELTN